MQPIQLRSRPIFACTLRLVNFQAIANQGKAQVAPVVGTPTSLFAKTNPRFTINGYFTCAYSPWQERGTKRGLTFSPIGTKQHP